MAEDLHIAPGLLARHCHSVAPNSHPAHASFAALHCTWDGIRRSDMQTSGHPRHPHIRICTKGNGCENQVMFHEH